MYLVSSTHISAQTPFSKEWMHKPSVFIPLKLQRANDPDFKQWIPPMTARRMSPIVKRAIATSMVVLKEANIEKPQAIITGTGLGCIENTEKFLSAMVNNGEMLLQPTHFIQSTHNTISSQIALFIDCNAYNSTYVHGAVSFEHALLDAFTQIKLGYIENALVGGHDELTEDYFTILSRVPCWRNQAFASEGSTAFLFAAQKTEQTKAKITHIQLTKDIDKAIEAIRRVFTNDSLEMIVTGRSSDLENDSIYQTILDKLEFKGQIIDYKQICGEYFTASAFGLYAAVEHLNQSNANSILFLNHWRNQDFSIIRIEKC